MKRLNLIFIIDIEKERVRKIRKIIPKRDYTKKRKNKQKLKVGNYFLIIAIVYNKNSHLNVKCDIHLKQV